MLFSCSIVFQCNLVKYFGKYMLFLSKSGFFNKKVSSGDDVYLGMVLTVIYLSM